MGTMSDDLVSSFNALPRKPRAPIGRVSNEWYFDLRYVHLEPTPSHILFILHPQLQFAHVARLPLGVPNDSSGITFFLDSGLEAAAEVSRTLLHIFININNLEWSDKPHINAVPPFAPWKLTTMDKTLAAAVGAEFKKLGVRAEELHKIGVSSPLLNRDSQAAFDILFQSIKSKTRIGDHNSFPISIPMSISFHNFNIAPSQPTLGFKGVAGLKEFELALQYARCIGNSRPPEGPDQPKGEGRAREEAFLIQERIRRKPEITVRNLADQGHPEDSLDYGMRYWTFCDLELLLSLIYTKDFFLDLGAEIIVA
jgi:hypothetical protein